jgi:stage II sporulation protein D (peptidoglycan lytic transglycosylase)
MRPIRLDDRPLRVAIPATNPRIGGSQEFGWYQSDGRTLVARGRRGDQWSVEANGTSQVRALRPDGTPTVWQRTLVARTDGNGLLMLNGKRYRGELHVSASRDSGGGVLVVNRLPLEDYLRGVVPVEIGNRPRGDTAALQAQAIASRSYAYLRAVDGGGTFDVRAGTSDQVYGGADVENPLASAAVDATRGLVLIYQGRIADAPFHSTCGGTTAESPEVWRTNAVPYLKRVSDRVGNTDRFYCDAAPRYRWNRALSAAQLNAALDQYLRAYATVPSGGPGAVRTLTVRSQTPSGRVGILEIETERGTFPVRGNDTRYVMRSPGGEILSSTYFSVEPEYGRDGLLSRVTIRGQGYGHGIGMCQWGAIGRARAGQSYRTILSTYYPGTTVGPVQ